MTRFIPVIIRRWDYPILVGVMLAWGALWGVYTVIWLALTVLAVFVAISRQGHIFTRLVWLVLPLLGLAAVSWLQVLPGIAMAVLTALSLQGLTFPAWRNAALAFGAFLVFANVLVFSVSFFELEALVMIFGILALWVIIGAGIYQVSSRIAAALDEPGAPALKNSDFQLLTLILLLIQSQMIMLLRFLPYGYLTLAAIAGVWHFVFLSISQAHLEGRFQTKKALLEISAAAALTLIAALVSGVRPR